MKLKPFGVQQKLVRVSLQNIKRQNEQRIRNNFERKICVTIRPKSYVDAVDGCHRRMKGWSRRAGKEGKGSFLSAVEMFCIRKYSIILRIFRLCP